MAAARSPELSSIVIIVVDLMRPKKPSQVAVRRLAVHDWWLMAVEMVALSSALDSGIDYIRRTSRTRRGM
jgi:hypothetical protein